MSALGNFASALLPPEAGGPDPERVAGVARRMVNRMPAVSRAGLGAALVGIEAFALARGGRRLGALPVARREQLLDQIARLGGSPAIDAAKSVVLLAAGADAYAEEIFAVGGRHEPSRPDADLNLIPGAEWPRSSSCEAIVVGSGAGGAFAARALARAGLDTVVVEEGERWDVDRIRSSHPLDRFAGIYRDGGTTMALGNPPIALPPAVARAWHERHGLAHAAPELLGRRVADAEATIGVERASMEVLGRNGELALEGAAALDWPSAPLRRNATGCRGACQCAIGCPNNAKGGVHLNALPQACAAGARIASGLRVTRVLHENGRATGVAMRSAGGGEVTLHAPLVVVAAGAIPTPPLLRRSGLGRHPRLGRNLSIHPATGITAGFDEAVVPWSGVMQSVGIDRLHESEGVLIEATSTPPGMGAVSAPGYGTHLVGRLERAANTATLGAMIADEPSGRVFGSRSPLVTYRLAPADRRRLQIGVEAMARVMLAAGAERVELGGGAPAVRSEAELAGAMESLDVRRLRLAAFHPSGTAAAGSDPSHHPVDPEGRLRGVKGVWVADGSILPSCPGVNPQVSIMAIAAGVGEAAAGPA